MLPARFRTLRWRLFGSLTLAIGGVVALVVIGWRLTIEPALRLGVGRHQVEVARRAADQIDDFLGRRLAHLVSASEIERLWRGDRGSQKDALYRLLKLDPALQEVFVADATGHEVVRSSRIRVIGDDDLRSIRDTAPFARAVGGELYIGDVFHIRTAEPMVTLAVPIRATARDIVGILGAEVNLKTLWDSISHIKVGEAGYAFVVDRRGTIIAHADYSKVLLGTTLASQPAVARFLSDPGQPPGFGRTESNPDGASVISTFAVVGRPQWAVVIEEPTVTALAEMRQVARFGIALVVAAILGAFAISYRFSRRIARPVSELQQGVERIARGDLEYRLKVTTGDEIQELADRFNEMAGRLLGSTRKVDANLQTLQRSLRVRSACNAALTRASDEPQFLGEICRALVDLGGYQTVAVTASDGDADSARTVARAGDESDPASWPARDATDEPARPAIRDGRPRVDRSRAPAMGIGVARGPAMIALSLLVDEEVFGALTVCSTAVDTFDAAETELLTGVAEDVAYGLSTLRARAERAAAQERVGRSERRFRGLIEHSADAIALLDATGVIVYVSPSTDRLLGYATGDLLGRRVTDFVHADDLRAIRSTSRAIAARPSEAQRLMLRIRRSDSGWRWVEGIANNLLIDPGVEGIVVNWWDVTQRVEADAERERLEQQVRQAQKMEAVGRLAGGIAHDFNNLLTVIIGRAEILSRARNTDDSRRNVDLIQQTAKRAAELTRQLLAFSRRQTLRPQILNLNDRLTSLLPILRRLIGEDVPIVTGFQPDLGLVKVDPSQLEQVVLNLAVNARDAMPRGGRLSMETANVELDEPLAHGHPDAGRGPHVVMRITDTGVGMAPDVLARVFEPFFTTKGVGRGTGLGLSTTYGIVKQHDGFITVESEPEQGTVFSVYFPYAGDTASVVAPAHREAPVGRARGETVLLVEDETEVRRLARGVLEDCGYTVLEAAGPQEAMHIATYHANGIDLLLTDVVMPAMSGRELAERVCATRPSTRVLYLSGYTDEALGVHGILSSDVAFLQKPFTLDSLTGKVREVLDLTAEQVCRV